MLMPISMYEASVPVFRQMLTSIDGCIDKAVANATPGGYEPAALMRVRLADDMMPFAQQIEVATNNAAATPARLAGRDLPFLGDDERTFDQSKARIARTLAFLDTVTPAEIDGTEDKLITIPKRNRVRHLELAGLPPIAEGQYPMSLYPMTFQGRDYLLHFALPNFFFHIAMAYAILRYAGVDIGKHDYFGQLPRIDR
jgi:hypothetical protein